MTFTGNQHNVLRLCYLNGGKNCGFPVGNDRIGMCIISKYQMLPRYFSYFSLINPRLDFADDSQWIFATRIVGRYNRQIAVGRCRFAHQWSLGAVTITAAAKNSQYFSLLHLI